MRFEVTDRLAERTAEELHDAIVGVLRTDERCSLALSGGHGPAPAFRALARMPIDFARVDVFQVDERVAPRGHPDRNLTLIEDAFLSNIEGDPPRMYEMPVDGTPDPDRYAHELPAVLDVVHLGMGPDGHTASLVPGDPVLEVRDRRVAMSGPYQNYLRMTMTYPTLDAAAKIIFMIDGETKRDALRKLEAGDTSIPAARIAARDVLVLTDVSGG
jgi:6-phosphogluconolactonase